MRTARLLASYQRYASAPTSQYMRRLPLIMYPHTADLANAPKRATRRLRRAQTRNTGTHCRWLRFSGVAECFGSIAGHARDEAQYATIALEVYRTIRMVLVRLSRDIRVMTHSAPSRVSSRREIGVQHVACTTLACSPARPSPDSRSMPITPSAAVILVAERHPRQKARSTGF
ncbi:uncharacterized protein FIBRA_09404 [Fibroporia radiculosa]|uniref:Uncharacterized protein n=1 Tax=Fibroporia radiculosa TaxID=599839 RepID=J7RVY5_9APHY|nr:uncharacterized protein FIBRA_09404 [Fibroporia radiculosa]CCM07080.1 predicted protein [Fibroporia radiculosa]